MKFWYYELLRLYTISWETKLLCCCTKVHIYSMNLTVKVIIIVGKNQGHVENPYSDILSRLLGKLLTSITPPPRARVINPYYKCVHAIAALVYVPVLPYKILFTQNVRKVSRYKVRTLDLVFSLLLSKFLWVSVIFVYTVLGSLDPFIKRSFLKND